MPTFCLGFNRFSGKMLYIVTSLTDNLLTHIGIENTITKIAFLLFHQKINGIPRATMRIGGSQIAEELPRKRRAALEDHWTILLSKCRLGELFSGCILLK